MIDNTHVNCKRLFSCLQYPSFVNNRNNIKTASADSVKLNHDDDDDNTVIATHTLIWAGGVAPGPLIANLPCDHDKGGRITVNDYLQVHRYPDVFALGDCASITDPHTGKPYPPTAQHTVREGKVVAKNLISAIKSSGKKQEEAGEAIAAKEGNKNSMISFVYKTKGVMAETGKRTGVGDLQTKKRPRPFI